MTCTGDCTWVCLGGALWHNTHDGCEPPCQCFAPTHKGLIDDVWVTDCNLDKG